jgi:hypothetical protein
MSALGACGTRGATAVRAIIAVAIALAACGDKLPSRPDEAKFRAASEGERCRLTASRAIMCTDELIVAQLRSIEGVDGELAGVVEDDIAKTTRLPKQTRKENIALHKTTCAADPGYPGAVFACWSQTDCKQFATCVVQKSVRIPPSKLPSEPTPSEAAPAPAPVPMAVPPTEPTPAHP